MTPLREVPAEEPIKAPIAVDSAPVSDEHAIDEPTETLTAYQHLSKLHEGAMALKQAFMSFLAKLNAQQTHSLASGMDAEERKLIELHNQHTQATEAVKNLAKPPEEEAA